jgi:hypothetical protein
MKKKQWVQQQALSQVFDPKQDTPKYTVFVPSDHEILLKVVPQKEFFEKKKGDQSQNVLEEFGLDEKTQLIDEITFDVERKYAGMLDTLACKLPVNLLKNIASTYMGIRGIKGNKSDIRVDDGLVLITDSKGKQLNIRLDHMLAIICSALSDKDKKILKQEQERLANYTKKVAETSKIEAETRKSF